MGFSYSATVLVKLAVPIGRSSVALFFSICAYTVNIHTHHFEGRRTIIENLFTYHLIL